MSLPASFSNRSELKAVQQVKHPTTVRATSKLWTQKKKPSIACSLSGPTLYSRVDSGELRFITETTKPKYAAPLRHCYGESYTSAVRTSKAKSRGCLCLTCWLSLLEKKSWTSMPELEKICSPWGNSSTLLEAHVLCLWFRCLSIIVSQFYIIHLKYSSRFVIFIFFLCKSF